MNNSPTQSHDGTLERTPDGGVIRFVRHLPYDIADVWDAITNPAQLGEWWLPFDAEITVDLRQGGEIVFAADGDEPIRIVCTITAVEPPTLLEHTHVDENSLMRWELEPTESGSVLRLSHFVTDIETAITRCYVVGLHTSLSRLEPCLAGRPASWDWADFGESQSRYASVGLAAPVEVTQ